MTGKLGRKWRKLYRAGTTVQRYCDGCLAAGSIEIGAIVIGFGMDVIRSTDSTGAHDLGLQKLISELL